MGTFKIKLRISSLADRTRSEELEALVDTGAALSWISRERLQRLGIMSSEKMPFRTIDGRVLERELAEARVSTDGASAPDLVVMAEPGEMEVIGARSIEGLGMTVDPVQQKLVRTVMPAL